ncbi:MAG: hypothetical protein ACTS2F_28905 [Thainema sp.]
MTEVASRYEWDATPEYPTVQDALAIVTKLPDGSEVVGYPVLSSPDAEIKLFQVKISGDPFVQTDLARLIRPGDIAIAVCGYYPDLHENEIPHKRNIGHAGLAVGVEKDGKAGVMTINNPQGYFSGGFNNSGYGSFFFEKIEFPAELSDAEKQAYCKNILTMTAISNSYIPFAEENFNGQDPLGIHNVDKIKQAGEKLILAVYGDEAAIEWLKRSENTAYCAELVSAGINIGTNTILNKAYINQLQQRLGADRYPNLYEVVREKIESGAVLQNNGNPNKAYIPLTMVDESVDLKPITERCPNADQSGTGLAFMYYDFTDIAYASIRDTYPRRDLAGLTGDELAAGKEYNAKVAQVQIHAFKEAAKKFKELAGVSPQVAAAFDQYVEGAVIPALSKVYPSQAERDAVMAELVEQGRQFTPTGPDGEGMFIPPDLYLRPTTGWAKVKNIGVGFFPESLKRIG